MVVKKKKGGPPAGGPKNAKKATTRHNPFEVRKNVERSAVLGKMQPANVGKGHSHAHAFELRKNTIQVEMEKQEKHNTFIDKREREVLNTRALSSHEIVKLKFDKLLGRSQKERGAPKKKNIFNLADEEVSMTGTALGIKSLPEPELPNEPQAGGEEAKDNLKKTNKERFAEIIAKSKYHKYLRQKDKEEREQTTDELNQQFRDMQQDFFSTKRTRADTEADKDNKDPDDYMKLLRTFEMEGRAPATDRSRTTEEVMREENEKLLKLEEERLQRMLGELQGAPKKPAVSGDDLTDDFTYGQPLDGDDAAYGSDQEGEEGEEDDGDDAAVLAQLLEEERRRPDESDEGEDEEEEIEDEDEAEEDEEGEDEEEGEEVQAAGEEGEQPKSDVPFRIDVPENYKAFAKLLAGRSAHDRAVIVDRIMVGSHYSLNRAQNVPKMRSFLRILWQRFNIVSKFKDGTQGVAAKTTFAELNHISKYMWELAQQFPEITYHIVKDTLNTLYPKFIEDLKDNATEALSMQIVAVLQIIGNIFPVTDFQNSIVTPTFTFLSHAISLAPIVHLSHLTRALFLASLSSSWLAESHRFITEPLTLLGSLLEYFANPDPRTKRYYTFPSLLTFDSSNLKFTSKPSKLSPKPLDFATLAFTDSATLTDQQKLDILHLTILLTSKFFDTYCDSKSKTNFKDCVPQLFAIIRTSLGAIESQALCKSIQDVVKPLISKIDEQVKGIEATRKALALQATGPVAIEHLEPHYQADYNGRKPKLSELPEQYVKNKMKKRVRKEELKAQKDLTRDTQFIAREWAKKRKLEDEATKAHTTKVMALLEKEAHEKKQEHIRKNPIKFFKK